MFAAVSPLPDAADAYDERLLRAFFVPHPPQAKAKDPKLHFRSLENALRHVRGGLAYVADALRRWDVDEWPLVEDAVARELSASTMFLGGVLGGMVILEATLSGQEPTASMSFERTRFQGSAELRAAQEEARDLKSSALDGQPLYADFWTLVNFWKHYFPYQPRPSVFERCGGARDFGVALGGGCNSGPVMR